MPRFRTHRQYLLEQFPYKVYKIPLDAGFTCPNIDGTVAVGGCTYCDNRSFSPNTRMPPRPLDIQIKEGMAFYRNRFGAEKYIAYLQAFTNTHAPADVLRSRYDQALSHPDIVGLSIGTRPDCVPEEVLDLLSEYAARTHLWIEYGLQTVHDGVLENLNRAHSYAQCLDAVERTRRRGIPVCLHVILGLPGETHGMMMETAEAVALMDVQGLKIHHLYIAKNTALEKAHREKPIPVFSLEAYIQTTCDFLERIPAGVVIERVIGELNEAYVVAPTWGRSKGQILELLDKEFDRRGTAQGALFQKSPA